MRIKVIVALLLILSLLVLSVNANSVTTTTTTFDIIAGNSVDINFTIDYTDSKDTTCHVSTSISPDGIGINLTYNPTFILKSHTTTLYYIHMNTSILLAPGTYTLTTTFQTEGAEPVIRHRTHVVSQGSVLPIPPINETQPPINDTEENETIPPIIISPVTESGFNWLWLIVPILIIVTLLILLYKRKKKEIK